MTAVCVWLWTGDPFELMVQFFGKFGDKPCCITDLKVYLHLLLPEQHVQVGHGGVKSA